MFDAAGAAADKHQALRVDHHHSHARPVRQIVVTRHSSKASCSEPLKSRMQIASRKSQVQNCNFGVLPISILI
jgi:hypothetical protein